MSTIRNDRCGSSASSVTSSLSREGSVENLTRMQVIQGRRPPVVEVLSLDNSGSWKVLSRRSRKKKRQNHRNIPVLVSFHSFIMYHAHHSFITVFSQLSSIR